MTAMVEGRGTSTSVVPYRGTHEGDHVVRGFVQREQHAAPRRSSWNRLLRFLLVEPRYRFAVWHRFADIVVVLLIAWALVPHRPWLTAGVVVLSLGFSPTLYRNRLTISVLDILPRLVVVGAVVTLIGAVVTSPGMSVASLLGFTAVVVSALLVSRIVVSSILRWSRRRYRAFRNRTIIVGGSEMTIKLAGTLAERPEFGLSPVAFVDSAPLPPALEAATEFGFHVETPEEGLVEVIRRHRARTVIIGFGAASDKQLLDWLWDSDYEDVEVYIVPRLFGYVNLDGEMDRVNALPLIRVRRAANRSFWWRFKRPMDLLASAIALVLLSPLLLALAIAVKLDDPSSPILFRQVRIGEGGREFELLKFRSMRPADDAESQTRWCIAGDPRISRLGSFLRKSSLDELPQIYNVFRGDMALVGPRPERPHFVEKFSGEYGGYAARHRVPVGLTGWAAINGLRGDTSIADRVTFDNYYISNWSPWMDIRSVLLTLWVVVKGTGR